MLVMVAESCDGSLVSDVASGRLQDDEANDWNRQATFKMTPFASSL